MIVQEYKENGQEVKVILENNKVYILWNSEIGSRKVSRQNASELTTTWEMYVAMAKLSK